MCSNRYVCAATLSSFGPISSRDAATILFLAGLVASMIGLFALAEVDIPEQSRGLLRRIVGTAIFVLLIGGIGAIAEAIQSDFVVQSLGIVGVLVAGALGTLLQSWGGIAAQAIESMPHRHLMMLGSWLIVAGLVCEVVQIMLILAGLPHIS